MIPERVDLPLPRSLTETEALRAAPEPLDWKSSEESGRRALSTAVPGIFRADIIFLEEGRGLELRFESAASAATREQLLQNVLKAWLPALGVDAASIFVEACRYGLAPLIDEGLRARPSTETLGRALLATPSAPLAERLLREGADANARRPNGVTALINAARYGQLDLMRLLLSKGADPDAASTDGEITALGQALASPAVGKSCAPADAVKALLEAGADANAPAGGWTPLLIALSNDDADSVGALLAAGADPKARSPDGATAADLARRASPKTRERFEKAPKR